jgi:hypothetical protein
MVGGVAFMLYRDPGDIRLGDPVGGCNGSSPKIHNRFGLSGLSVVWSKTVKAAWA